jgi:hypothetical protein
VVCFCPLLAKQGRVHVADMQQSGRTGAPLHAGSGGCFRFRDGRKDQGLPLLSAFGAHQ